MRFLFRYGYPTYLKWMGFRGLVRKAIFPFMVSFQNGRLQMASSVRFDHPVHFLGQGCLILEENVSLGYPWAGSITLPILFEPREREAVIRIGQGTAIVNGSEFIARSSITIGANCRIGARCSFLDSDFHGLKPDQRHTPGLTAPIVIENNVWFGNEAMVLKGVHIGQDAVIGARCVITKHVPAGSIVVGNPMKVVGTVYA